MITVKELKELKEKMYAEQKKIYNDVEEDMKHYEDNPFIEYCFLMHLTFYDDYSKTKKEIKEFNERVKKEEAKGNIIKIKPRIDDHSICGYYLYKVRMCSEKEFNDIVDNLFYAKAEELIINDIKNYKNIPYRSIQSYIEGIITYEQLIYLYS